MTQIDLTPTRSEHARITAYILASHLKGSPYQFGDYWNFTKAEEDALFATWNQLEQIHKVYLNGGMDFYKDAPKAHKAKLIIRLYNQNLAITSKQA
jgi:hypothetical protein